MFDNMKMVSYTIHSLIENLYLNSMDEKIGWGYMPDFVLYTVKETKEILKVTQRTLYNYIKNGDLKAVKIGKYWRIRQSDLAEFIENGTSNNLKK